jgi:SPP1 gp7 family putative phage head morphogenesis protein
VSEIDRAITAGLGDLEAGEADVIRKVQAVYEQAYRSVSTDLEVLLRKIDRAQRDGEEISPDWLRRQARYRKLLANITEVYEAAGGRAATLTAEAQRIGALHGYQVAGDLLDLTMPGSTIAFATGEVPAEAVNRFASATTLGSPLNDVFSRWGSQAVQIFEQTIGAGITEGHGLRKTARRLHQQLAGQGTRSAVERIVRTESMRAFRGAQVDQYRRSGDVQRVRWVAALSQRTCLYCLHMHNQTFPIDEAPTSQHPNCRCTLTPVPRVAYASLQQFYESGEAWLRRQPIDVQLDMIGGNRQAVDAFRDGKLTLANFAGERSSSAWGRTGYQRSGKAALVDAGIPLQLRRLREPSNQGPMPPQQPPAPGPRQSPQDTAAIEEARIRSIADHEEAILIDSATGAVVWRKDGQQASVDFNAAEIAQMRGQVLTHNHPLGWRYPADDPRSAGSSFSSADVAMMVTGQLAEIRAISPKYLHILRPPSANDRSPQAEQYRARISKDDYRTILNRTQVFSDIVRYHNQQRVNDPGDPLTREQAEANHADLVMRELVVAWGVEYERKEWIP